MICPSKSSRECVVEISHVIVECRVINHHPTITAIGQPMIVLEYNRCLDKDSSDFMWYKKVK